MSKKKCKRKRAAIKDAQAYRERRMAIMDEMAEAVAKLYDRKTPFHLVALVACALVQAEERDAKDVLEKGGLQQEGEEFVLSYNVDKVIDAYLDANRELARYADYLAYLFKERPAWVEGWADGGLSPLA